MRTAAPGRASARSDATDVPREGGASPPVRCRYAPAVAVTTELRFTATERHGDVSALLLHPPDATTLRGTAAWTQQEEPRYVFVVNYDLSSPSGYFGIPGFGVEVELIEEFSTVGGVDDVDRRLVSNGFFHRLENLWPGEGRVYKVE